MIYWVFNQSEIELFAIFSSLSDKFTHVLQKLVAVLQCGQVKCIELLVMGGKINALEHIYDFAPHYFLYVFPSQDYLLFYQKIVSFVHILKLFDLLIRYTSTVAYKHEVLGSDYYLPPNVALYFYILSVKAVLERAANDVFLLIDNYSLNLLRCLFD